MQGAAPDFVWGAAANFTHVWRGAAPNVVLSRYVAFTHDPTCAAYTHPPCTHDNLTWWKLNHPTWVLYRCDRKTPVSALLLVALVPNLATG